MQLGTLEFLNAALNLARSAALELASQNKCYFNACLFCGCISVWYHLDMARWWNWVRSEQWRKPLYFQQHSPHCDVFFHSSHMTHPLFYRTLQRVSVLSKVNIFVSSWVRTLFSNVVDSVLTCVLPFHRITVALFLVGV